MRYSSSALLLAFANILLPVAVVVFAVGFFPYKPILPGIASFDNEDVARTARAEAPFDKVIFMVIDALRSDFVFSNTSEFKFTQSLISSGNAIPYTAHAASPTITMPRIKALTTGSVPSFLDVILNFVESDTTSNLANQDTWLSQIKARGGRLIFHGDDTWLKLFPNFFARADGTSSFFVSDFTEVDNNVTRHIPDELNATDWDAMILHYLGLDHIGHKTGPKGPSMGPKQAEMDTIVERVYKAMTTKANLESTLLVVLGDHGMNEGGNHGGTAIGETSPALVFISPKLKQIPLGYHCPAEEPQKELQYYKVVDQSDVVPTLAILLGLPVSRNSLGVFITDFLPLWSQEAGLKIIQRNAQQLFDVVRVTFSSASNFTAKDHAKCEDLHSSGDSLLCRYNEAELASSPTKKLDHLLSFCKATQEIMSIAASDYNIKYMSVGIALSFISFISVVPSLSYVLNGYSMSSLLGVTFTILYSVMMFASSFVEEEQHFWYWSLSGWILYLYFSSLRTNSKSYEPYIIDTLYIITLSFHRISQRWNQTGQKFAGADDISQSFLSKQPLLLWALVVATYMRILLHFRYTSSRAFIAAFAVCGMALAFKISFTIQDAPELLSPSILKLTPFLVHFSLLFQVRCVFLGLLAVLALHFYDGKTGTPTMSSSAFILQIRSLFLITQSRTQNIPLFLLYDVQEKILESQSLSSLQLAFSCLLHSHASFFALGNSNAISSIDLSNAYNGVSGYNVLAVAILLLASNWAGPIWWTLWGVSHLSQQTTLQATTDITSNQYFGFKGDGKSSAAKYMEPLANPPKGNTITTSSSYHVFGTVYTFFFASALLSIMVACLILRDHLFIWSVFSPKYLYVMAWTVAFHLGVHIGFGSIFRSLKQISDG